MGKKMHQLVISIAFVVTCIPFIECKSIHKRQSVGNFSVDELASEEVAATGRAEDSPGAIPDEVPNSTIVEIHENTTDVELFNQNNESQRVKRSRPSASKRSENNVCEKRRSKSKPQPPQVREMKKYLHEIVQIR